MTVTDVRRTTSERALPTHSGADAAGGTAGSLLAGTGALIRFVLRRERVKLPAWLLGMTALLSIFLRAVSELTATEEQRQDLRRIIGGSVGALMGPGYGRDEITTERYVVGVYGVFFFVLIALMNLLMVARHTRLEEQSGRAELVRSYAVGRHASLTAVLIVAVGANVLVALLLGGTMAANDFDASEGLLFGAGVGAVGLVFAGITALTVQLTEYSRAATGMAGALLGGAWAVRAAGDTLRDYGSPLSWFSPLAWSNQTRPYVDGRWWPLLLSVGLAGATIVSGYAMSARRDVGAGLVAARRGAPRAAPWLRSPYALALRLQRAGLMWWTLALALFGFVFGALGEQMADPEGMSSDRIEMFGGSVDTLLEGYIGMMARFTAGLAAITVVLGVQALRTEETRGRAEPVLATAASRAAWFGGYLAVISGGLVGLLLVAGLAAGLGTAVSVGDGSYLGEVAVAHLAHAPGVLVLLGIAALLFGVLPRAIGVTWAVVGASLFVGLFGTIMDLPRWAHDVLPTEHTGRPPLDGIAWPAIGLLLLIAAGLLATGVAAFARRDVDTK